MIIILLVLMMMIIIIINRMFLILPLQVILLCNPSKKLPLLVTLTVLFVPLLELLGLELFLRRIFTFLKDPRQQCLDIQLFNNGWLIVGLLSFCCCCCSVRSTILIGLVLGHFLVIRWHVLNLLIINYVICILVHQMNRVHKFISLFKLWVVLVCICACWGYCGF